MLENILLAVILPSLNTGEYFVVYSLDISETGEYFVVYCLAISECWGIFCWLLSCHYSMLEHILLVIVLLLVNAEEYFVGYCLVIS